MKNILIKLCSLLSLILIVSCEKEYPATGTIPPDQTVAFANSEVELLFNNSAQKFLIIEAENGVAWKVDSDSEWLTLSTKQEGIGYAYASGRGNGIVYLIATNYSDGDGSPREAKVTIDGTETFATIKQLRSGALESSLPSITFGCDAQTRSLDIAVADNTKEWTLTAVDAATGAEADWVTMATTRARSSVSGTGAQGVNVSVVATNVARKANVMNGDELLFEVYQTTSSFVEVNTLDLNITETDCGVGASVELIATINDDATDRYMQFNSSDSNIATVDQNGVVTAVAEGNATITVSAGELTASCEVTVIPAVAATGIALPEDMTIYMGDNTPVQLDVTFSPAGATNRAITWTSSDESVATIAKDGTVTQLKNGVTTITATAADGGFTDTCVITVETKVVSIEITGSETVSLNGTVQLAINFNPETASNQNITWTSSNPENVSIDATTGVATGLIAGESATITAVSDENNAISDTFEITVESIALESFSIDDFNISFGGTQTLEINYVPADASFKELTYSFDKEDIIKIEDGVLSFVATDAATAVAASPITVTATSTKDNTLTDTFTVSILKAYELGELYPNATTPVGIVVWVDPADASKGKVISIGQSDKFAWSKIEEETGANSAVDGQENTTKILNLASFNETNYPGYAWLKTNYIDNKAAMGNLDWYIPAFNELKEVFVAVYDYQDAAGTAAWLAEDNIAAKPEPGLIKENLNVFNDKYKEVEGYAKFAAAYWCSREGMLSGTSDMATHCVMFATGAQNLQAKTKTMTMTFRPIAKFGY